MTKITPNKLRSTPRISALPLMSIYNTISRALCNSNKSLAIQQLESNLDRTNEDGDTLLMIASREGSLDGVRLLIDEPI